MTDRHEQSMKFIDTHHDLWRSVGGDDGPMVTITPKAHLLLSLTDWHAVRKHWPADMPVGLKVANDAEIEAIAEDLPRLSMIALHFPKWVDGRAYSQARLLRTRHRFKGEVRATGDVLVDMLPLLARTGFDAVVMRADQSRDAAERALGFFPAHYQGDAQDHQPLFAKPPGWAEPTREFVNAGASI
jgi:uncharacterized protein (DUF934 family)